MGHDKHQKSAGPMLSFPTPPGFGEPISYLTVALNAQGQPHAHTQGTMEEILFLATNGLNHAISALVVASLQQSLGRAALPWPQARKEGNS